MKNNYEFRYDGQLEFIIKQIKKYKRKYKNIRLKYEHESKKTDNYITMMQLMEQYRWKFLNLLKEIIKKYTYFENNAVIYLTGSFARHTVRLFSDLDLNIVYINDSGEKYKKYEELFYYMISEIFEQSRKSVHSIITAFNDKKNLKCVKQNLNKEDIIVTLIDKKITIQYKIPYLSKKRFYLQYLNDKNYKTIFENLKKIYDSDGIQEWSNNFLFLNEHKLVYKCYEEYLSYILKDINFNSIKRRYKKIIKEIDNSTLDFCYIKNIKLVIQMRELHFIYNAVMILQLLGIVNEKTKFYNSFKDIIDNSNESLNKVMMYFYEYNYKLIKLNFMFKEYHLDYSIHTNQKINLNYYPLLKKEIDNIMCFMQEINKKILKILKEEVYINDK